MLHIPDNAEITQQCRQDTDLEDCIVAAALAKQHVVAGGPALALEGQRDVAVKAGVRGIRGVHLRRHA